MVHFAARSRQPLGEMLVEADLIDRETLEKALAQKPESDVKLGQLLVQNGLVKEKDLVRVVSAQLHVGVYNSERYPPDTALAELVPESMAHKLKLVPVKQEGPLLWVAMLDPTDLNALDNVVKQCSLDVEPIICTEQQYVTHFYAIYGRMLVGLDDVDIEGKGPGGAEDATFTISTLQYMAEDAPIVKLVNSMLVQALSRRASDIHIQPETDSISMRFRVDGVLEESPSPPKAHFLPFISRIKLLSGMDISVSRRPQDGRFTYRTSDREISVRTSTTPTIFGEKVVLRLLDQTGGALTLEELGMEDTDKRKLRRAIAKPYGMILATGPTGSGKTTLLYSVLRKLNTPAVNIVTLEDPVEYRVKGLCQIQLNRKAGSTFASGLRSILRQDPDIIMVGEVRDRETADIAIRSALTGHKVLSTLHTNNAADTITRFIEMGIEPFLISSTLLVSIAQRLVRTLCPKCKEPYAPSKRELHALGHTNGEPIQLYRPKGCRACRRTGFYGRRGVYEILEIDREVQEQILAKDSSATIRQNAIESGKLMSLKQNAAHKVLTGLTTIEEFAAVAFDD